MAPIRRYLRITKYSVLECRIYLDNPALAHTWLLNPRNPILPRVIESVRPLVLPKLREERERSRKRSTRKKGIKDVVVEDDFEVSIFLTETSTRHALLTKYKHFHDTTQTKLTSNSGRLINETNEAPIDVDTTADLGPVLRHEESEDENVAATLAAIPAANETAAGSNNGRRPKRGRRNTEAETDADRDIDDQQNRDVEILSDSQDDGDDGLFVQDDPPDDEDGIRSPPAKRRRGAAAKAVGGEEADNEDDKKKLAMDISYEGFSIYGRVLCLVVKRRDGNIGAGPQPAGRGSSNNNSSRNSAAGSSNATKPGGGGQAMMENFILSTQVPAGAEIS
ncbi:uncharacterized protein F4822DRAFT_441665 [Hypoxylon trugodes]|uniref:uncharacterized protein n=1 Tax=Hypoxylon trugodes TaxID=326681 RepID=UPI0021967D81|nr:uncharacterized protein F4822DRAFT_441665 [Hypoxylon trugodes]KAI1392930.1 hypothetical protein F4822DRAFT_441665 [Hypoxylon trugodes]